MSSAWMEFKELHPLLKIGRGNTELSEKGEVGYLACLQRCCLRCVVKES